MLDEAGLTLETVGEVGAALGVLGMDTPLMEELLSE
ncbi:hypothetical protein LCGC14_2727110, partial [marine sediment metagenome]